jgi:hypothetical protein
MFVWKSGICLTSFKLKAVVKAPLLQYVYNEIHGKCGHCVDWLTLIFLDNISSSSHMLSINRILHPNVVQ